jgi:hypothetical protein
MTIKIPNGHHKIDQTAVNRPNVHNIYQHRPLQNRTKFTQIEFLFENIQYGNPESFEYFFRVPRGAFSRGPRGT